MKSIDEIELGRAALQQACDAQKTQEERNRLGQFATPSQLALEILRFAEKVFPAESKVRFLDPAFGTGAFYSALLQVFGPERIEKSTGFEIDSHYADPAARLWRQNKLELHPTDFTKAPQPNERSKFNLIICNPPYVRHHHLSAAEKTRLYRIARSAAGANLSGLAGLYCYFLLLSDAWAADGCLCVWLIPSEFMDVNYGAQLKEYLLTRVSLLHIHRFASEDVQFGDALVSSAVVCFRKAPPTKGHSVHFSFGGTLNKPRTLKTVPLSSLRPESKWNGSVSATKRSSSAAKLSDIFDIKRGLATGDNSFFILTPERVRENGLPMKFLRPILPSPRYLAADEIAPDRHGNPILDRKLFLLDCDLPEHEVHRDYPRLAEYLALGKDRVAKGYLCRSRSPWYSQENRPAPLLLCTYMGRHRKKNGSPFRFILNHSNATAANVYLLLYPKAELKTIFKDKPELVRSIWQWLNALSPELVLTEGRVYGGGLHKLEPRELGNVPADGICALLGQNPRKPSQQLHFFTHGLDSVTIYP